MRRTITPKGEKGDFKFKIKAPQNKKNAVTRKAVFGSDILIFKNGKFQLKLYKPPIQKIVEKLLQTFNIKNKKELPNQSTLDLQKLSQTLESKFNALVSQKYLNKLIKFLLAKYRNINGFNNSIKPQNFNVNSNTFWNTGSFEFKYELKYNNGNIEMNLKEENTNKQFYNSLKRNLNSLLYIIFDKYHKNIQPNNGDNEQTNKKTNKRINDEDNEKIINEIKNIAKSYIYLYKIFGKYLTDEIIYMLYKNGGFDQIEAIYNSINGQINKLDKNKLDKKRQQLFKNIIIDYFLENGKIDAIEIKKRFERHYIHGLYNLFNIFIQRYNSADLNYEELELLYLKIKEIIDDIKYLKENGFFAEQHFIKNNKTISDILDGIRKENILGKKSNPKNNKIFQELLEFINYFETKEKQKNIRSGIFGKQKQQITKKIKEIKEKRNINRILDSQVKLTDLNEEKLKFFENLEQIFKELKQTIPLKKGTKTKKLLKLLGINKNKFQKFVKGVYEERYAKTGKFKNFEEYLEIINTQLKNTYENWLSAGQNMETYIQKYPNDIFLLVSLYEYGKQQNNQQQNYKIQPTSSLIKLKYYLQNPNTNLNNVEILNEKIHGEVNSIRQQLELLDYGYNNGFINGPFDTIFDIEYRGKTYKLVEFKQLITPKKNENNENNENIENHIKKLIELLQKDYNNELTKKELNKLKQYFPIEKNGSNPQNNKNLILKEILQKDINKIKIIKYLKYILFLINGGDNENNKSEKLPQTIGLKQAIQKGNETRNRIITTLLGLKEEKELKKEIKEKEEKLKEIFDNYSQNGVDFSKKLNKGAEGIPGIHIGPSKNLSRALEKLIYSYHGNVNKLTDTARFAVEYDSLEDLYQGVSQFISYLNKNKLAKQISIVDKIGNIYELAKLPTGYRDLKLFIKTSNGNIIEAQFQLHDLYEYKINGINANDPTLKEKLRYKENKIIQLTQNELKQLIEIIKYSQIKLPNKTFFEKYLLEKGTIPQEYDKYFEESEYISTDLTYDISRIPGLPESIKQKFQKLESIINEIAWGKILAQDYKLSKEQKKTK